MKNMCRYPFRGFLLELCHTILFARTKMFNFMSLLICQTTTSEQNKPARMTNKNKTQDDRFKEQNLHNEFDVTTNFNMWETACCVFIVNLCAYTVKGIC